MIFLILALSAFLRFYQLPGLAIFTFDEEHQITMAQTIVNHFHIIWIGVSASNLGFYLGPFWVYFTAFWLFLSKGDPLITNYVAAGIGVITTFLIYYIASRMFSVKAGLIAALLYATLPVFVYFDQKYLTPNPVPLLSLLLFFSIYKSFKSPGWWIVFALLFGLTFHTSLSIFPYGFLGFYYFFKQRKRINKTTVVLSVLVFLLTISPLIAFDYFHKWSNITTPLRFREFTSSASGYNVITRFNYLTQTLGRIWYLKPGLANADEIPFACETIFKDKFPNYDFNSIRTKPFWGFSILSLVILIWFLIKPNTWKKLESKMLALSAVFLIGSFLFFHGGPFEYYLLGVFPLMLIIFGVLVSTLTKKLFIIPLIFIAVVSTLGIKTVLDVNKSYGLGVKKQLIGQVMKVIKTKPFELQNNGVCHEYDGWRYLFSVYGRKPERSDTDKSLGWLYPKEITAAPVQIKVIMSEAKIVPAGDISKAVIIEKGGFKAYIINYEDSYLK